MKKYLSLFIASLVLAAGAYYSELWFLSYSRLNTNAARGDTLQGQGVTSAAFDATSTQHAGIDFTLSAGDKNYNGAARAGTTVLDAMNSLTAEADFQFTSKEFPGMGAFVESINGKENADGFYWMMYVNGKLSEAGASQTTLNNGDNIEWRYESR